jgi:outer membrane protein OmpA-like peptidoglycan-associated protein
MDKKSGKGLGTSGTILAVGGALIILIGGYLLYKRYKKISECTKAGGTWDKETNSCILPKKEVIQEKQILKDAYDNLTFETAKAIIKPASLPFLDEIAVVFANEDAKPWKLEIKGHTDNKGTESYNQKLSEERANSVKTYLISKGIEGSKITSSGFGLSKPIATNDTAEGRAKNRRVEFSIIKPTGEIVTTQTQTVIPAEVKPEQIPVETVVVTKNQTVTLGS